MLFCLNYLARVSLTDFPATECLSVSAHHDWHVPRFYVQALKITSMVIKVIELSSKVNKM